jgi:hypothetical protein
MTAGAPNGTASFRLKAELRGRPRLPAQICQGWLFSPTGQPLDSSGDREPLSQRQPVQFRASRVVYARALTTHAPCPGLADWGTEAGGNTRSYMMRLATLDA